MSVWPCILALAVGIALGLPALAGPVQLDGLTFSDELGGFDIVNASGSGSLEDPFVLVENITGDGPAILTIRGMTHAFGNRIRSHHDVGFALTKVVRNRTKRPWSLFNLELRESIEQASPFGDGLSFGQASEAGRPFRSDRFAEVLETDRALRRRPVFGGLVAPGETVAVSVVVTDTTPTWEFFLLQTEDSPLAALPPSGSPRIEIRAGLGDTRGMGALGNRLLDAHRDLTRADAPLSSSPRGVRGGSGWWRAPSGGVGTRRRGLERRSKRNETVVSRRLQSRRRGQERHRPQLRPDGRRHTAADRGIARSYFHGLGWIQYGLAGIGVVLILVGLVAPDSLSPLHRAWDKLGLILFRVVNPVVLALIYAIVIVPVGFLMRATGRDPLRLKRDAQADSYWIVRDPPGPAPDTMTNQF